jgi:hypothetical protein
MTNISNYMKGNPGTTLGLNAISLLTGIPGLHLHMLLIVFMVLQELILEIQEHQVMVVIPIMQVKFLKY